MNNSPGELMPAAVRVPCSTSNLGAGFDCIGLALDRWLEARYEPGPHPLRVERSGTLRNMTIGGDDLIARAFMAGAHARGHTDFGGVLHTESNIPVARGLGSSAAATVAGLALAAAASGDVLERGVLLARATEMEGHPDNAAPSLFGGLVAVARDDAGTPHAFELPLDPNLAFAFAAPDVEVATPRARAALPATVAHAAAARALGRTAALLHGLATGQPELLALGFSDELHVPYRLPLIPRAQEAFDAARAAGAYAVTISGSGSGIIAVCAQQDVGTVADAMHDAFGSGVAFGARTAERGVYGVRD